jgi:hypothetical protein
MSFINNEIFPIDPGESTLLLEQTFVRRDEHIELVLPRYRVYRQIVGHKVLTFLFGSTHANRLDGRTPIVEFSNPVPHYRLGNNDNVWTFDTTTFAEIGQKRNRLQSLTKAHFYGQEGS